MQIFLFKQMQLFFFFVFRQLKVQGTFGCPSKENLENGVAVEERL